VYVGVVVVTKLGKLLVLFPVMVLVGMNPVAVAPLLFVLQQKIIYPEKRYTGFGCPDPKFVKKKRSKWAWPKGHGTFFVFRQILQSQKSNREKFRFKFSDHKFVNKI
jgi:hypothetical protein